MSGRAAAGLLATLGLLLLGGCAQPDLEAAPDSAPAAAAPQIAETDNLSEVPVASTASEQPARPAPPPRRLTVAMVGDMMLGTDYPENRLPDDDGAGFLAKVAPILNEADLAFGNLEGVLADEAEPVKACTNPAACYLFRSPTRYARHFKAAGFDGLSLANNHALDFGEEGRSSTMQALAARGLVHSGREGDFASLRLQDLDIAFVAFAVTRNSNLLHDYELAFDIVAEQAHSHDLVIVSFHGGAEGEGTTRIPFAEEEYYGEPRGDVVRFARGAVDAGADLVFGHGPHVVRGMERYRDRLIAYSLGNFATYYGISVRGIKGIAPILVATIDEQGRFVEGRLHSTVQVRPGGPQPDAERRALGLVRRLSQLDFGDPGLEFLDDGRIRSTERQDDDPGAAVSSVR